MPDNQRNYFRGILYVGIAALCWSFVVVAIKIALPYVPSATIVWFRFFVSFAILFSVLFFTDRKNLFQFIKSPPLLVIFAALMLGVNYFGLMIGVKNTTPATTQIVIQSGPLFFALAGFVIFKEKPTFIKIMGVVTAFGGLILFYYFQSELTLTNLDIFNTGIIWILLSGFAWAIYSVFQKKLVKDHSPNLLNIYIYGLPALIFTPFVEYSSFVDLPLFIWGVLFFLALITIVSYQFLTIGYKYIEANKASVIITLNPIITFLIMWIFGLLEVTFISNEKITIHTLLGASLVITGVILACLKGKDVTSNPNEQI